MLKRILDGYDCRVRPPTGTSIVKVQIFVRRISDICSKDQELTVELTFRQHYVDPRLDFRRDSALIYVTVTDPSLIWKPDLFFSNGEIRKTHDTMIRIYNDGAVLLSQRVTVRLSCPMNLGKFPFDQQKCNINIASYAYKKDELELLWHEDNPSQVYKHLDLTNFVLKNVTLEDGQQKSSTGTYSYIVGGLVLKRLTNYYLIQIYIPCAMLVILSWLSFWINVKNQLLKSLFAMLSLITLALALTILNQNLPETSYTKAVDTWTGVCLTFIFAALIESVVVYYRTLKLTNNPTDDGQLDKHVCRSLKFKLWVFSDHRCYWRFNSFPFK